MNTQQVATVQRKRTIASGIAAVVVAAALSPYRADALPIMPLYPDGIWRISDVHIQNGEVVAGFLAGADMIVRITDLYVVGDSYEVYINGVFQVKTPSVPDWTHYVNSQPYNPFPAFGPPWTDDPNKARKSGKFSKGTFEVHEGDLVLITDISIPITFIDGTIAYSAIPLNIDPDVDGEFPPLSPDSPQAQPQRGQAPEPNALALLGVSLAGLVWSRRKRHKENS